MHGALQNNNTPLIPALATSGCCVSVASAAVSYHLEVVFFILFSMLDKVTNIKMTV